MSPLIVDKAEKKKQILEAALEVFIAKGYHNVNVSDIARQAGISKGALYIYFKSREELFRELFGFMAQTHRVRFGKKTTSHASPESKLRELISFYLQSYKKREKFLYILIDYISQNRAGKESSFLKDKLANINASFKRELSPIIAEGIKSGAFKTVDADAVAHIILTAADGIMFQHFFTRSAVSQKKTRGVLIDMIMGYIKKM